MSLSCSSAARALTLTLLAACSTGSVVLDSAAPVYSWEDLRVGPQVLDLGEVKVGDTVSGFVSMANLGDEDVVISARVNGRFEWTYSVSPSKAVLPAEDTVNFKVSFSPEGWGDHTANLDLQSERGETIFSVPIAVNVNDNDDD